MKLTPFVEFEFFIANGSRNLYYIFIDIYNIIHGMKDPIEVSNCSRLNRAIMPLNQEANKINSPLFSPAQSICFNMVNSNPVLPEDIAKACGFSDKQEFTIIFSVWPGHRTIPKQTRAISYKVFAPEYKESVTTSLPLTNALISDARAFLEDLIGGSNINFIAVHIRAERLLKQERLNNINSVRCLIKAIELANSIINSQDDIDEIIYFGDYHVSQFKDLLEKLKVKVVRFDPTKYGHTGVIDEAYIALVEQTAIAQAKQLVLVGGGTFQFHIIDKCECPSFKICGPAHQ